MKASGRMGAWSVRGLQRCRHPCLSGSLPQPAEGRGLVHLYLLYWQETESPGDGGPRSHSWRAGCQDAGFKSRLCSPTKALTPTPTRLLRLSSWNPLGLGERHGCKQPKKDPK